MSTTAESSSNCAERGFCTLHQAFDMTSANIPYVTNRAKQKLLQLPLAAIQIGKPGSGTAFTLLLEHYHGVDYKKMSVVLNGMVAHSQSDCSRPGKSMVKQLLGLAQSDREFQSFWNDTNNSSTNVWI